MNCESCSLSLSWERVKEIERGYQPYQYLCFFCLKEKIDEIIKINDTALMSVAKQWKESIDKMLTSNKTKTSELNIQMELPIEIHLAQKQEERLEMLEKQVEELTGMVKLLAKRDYYPFLGLERHEAQQFKNYLGVAS